MYEIRDMLDEVKDKVDEVQAEIDNAQFEVELMVPRRGMIQVRVEHMGEETEVDLDDLLCDLDERRLRKVLKLVQEAVDDDQ